jgi:capsular polysaccharide biosynthesis protein
MDFRTFVRILLANWKLAMTALLMCTIGAAAITAIQTKHYQASTTVLISFSGATDLTELYNGTLTAEERLSSYAQIAGGRTVAEKAISQLQVPIKVDDLVANTQVKYTAKSMLFTITVKDTDPRRAAALAGAMADQFAAIVPTLAMNTRPGAPPTTTTPGAPPTETETAPPPTPGQPAEVPGIQQFNGKPVPTARARVIEPPRVPEHAYSPAPVRNMAMGLVSGLLLAVTVALVRETTDRTVRNREKLERLSGLPTLGELPGKRGSVARFGTDVIFDDAVRDLRARLRRAMGPDGRRVLLVAPFGGEGTTTTVLNLGRAFAELGEDVPSSRATPAGPPSPACSTSNRARDWPARWPTPSAPPRSSSRHRSLGCSSSRPGPPAARRRPSACSRRKSSTTSWWACRPGSPASSSTAHRCWPPRTPPCWPAPCRPRCWWCGPGVRLSTSSATR